MVSSSKNREGITMNPAEQLALFKKVRRRFYRLHDKRWASGYVHGVVDEAACCRPDTHYRAAAATESYAAGYLQGFTDARGTDAAEESWWSGGKINFRWWWKYR